MPVLLCYSIKKFTKTILIFCNLITTDINLTNLLTKFYFQNLEDPALTPFEFLTRNVIKETKENAKPLLSLLKCTTEECKETWVENAEQVVNILSKTLPYVADSCREGKKFNIKYFSTDEHCIIRNEFILLSKNILIGYPFLLVKQII